MIRYIALCVAQMALVVTLVIFSTPLLLPGDPALAMLGEQSTLEQRIALRHEMGFDLPIPVQYVRWLAYVIAWSLWRRAHRAAAQTAHLKHKLQL